MTFWLLHTWVLMTGNPSNTFAFVKIPPAIFIEKHDPALHQVNGIWMMQEVLYNGYLIEKDSGVVIAKVPILEGKENGVAQGWYKSGKRKYERSFRHGNRTDKHRGWYENGTLAFEYYFREDKYEGEQKTFFENGCPWQSLHYVHGYEEGKQKSWNESGRVINNFTVKKGRLYGVIGRYDCMSVISK